METIKHWPVNCGAPLDPEKVKEGLTWCSELQAWLTLEDAGAETFKAPDGWWTFFGVPHHKGRRLLQEFTHNM